MFGLYFLVASLSMLTAFGVEMRPETRILMYFPIGLSVFGVFGSFTYYLPELFPTRLRGTGSGFCYNIGRVAAAVGPFLVGLGGRTRRLGARHGARCPVLGRIGADCRDHRSPVGRRDQGAAAAGMIVARLKPRPPAVGSRRGPQEGRASARPVL